MSKFAKVPPNTFKELQINAGVILNKFNPEGPTITVSASDYIGGTSGGVKFSAMPNFKDNGEGIDNCPLNMMELKEITGFEAKLSGNFISANTELAKSLCAAADISGGKKVVPRADLTDKDFSDIWFVGDYSDNTGEKNGGFIAIHLMHALSTGGFVLQTTDKDKGKYAFEYTAHYSIKEQTTVPFEIYISAGTPEA